MDVLVVGAGYAGLVTAAGLAGFGHSVTCIDLDEARIGILQAGGVPLYEPGLEDLIGRSMVAGTLQFVDAYAKARVEEQDAVFLVVGTPPLDDGTVDLVQLESAVQALIPHLRSDVVIVVKSTVPVGTARQVARTIEDARPELDFSIATNPEFLRQGAAVEDFVNPDRLVLGVDDDTTEETLRAIYGPLLDRGVPVVVSALESAELIKYASNAFLATKLSFINEIADLCEASGGVIDDVARGIGLDRRIGASYFSPGPGFGGSCLPKDTQALVHSSRSHGTGSHIVDAALRSNEQRVERMVERILSAAEVAEPTVGLLGITFKANTDDIRESPALRIAQRLVERDARVQVFDPEGLERAREILGDTVAYATDEYAAASGAHATVIATEWRQFGSMSLDRLRRVVAYPNLVDLRNLWDPTEVAAAGFQYVSIGRPVQDRRRTSVPPSN